MAAGPATCRLALVGFGTVGQGVTEILAQRRERYAREFGLDMRVVAVSDLNRGSIYDPAGFEPQALLDNAGDLERLGAPHKGWDALRTIRECNADAVLEMAYTDLETGEPGLSHARAALSNGKHIVMSSKGAVALHFPELLALANENGVSIGVEGTVMSGTPTLALATEMLKGAGVTRIEGILNGTTNYILTRMGEGLAYGDALAEAQQKGYAEADPTGDVEGIDAAGKVAILANLVMDRPLALSDVRRQGISRLTPADIEEARAAGQVWKLIGYVDGASARVEPRRIPASHPLAAISGATNAVTFTTDYLGEVTLIGPGAGKLETGYAMIGDLLKIARQGGFAAASRSNATGPQGATTT
ncbi:MAG TPA: homoserine dehydrogenase [Trueperaceae bacterium]